MVRFVTCRLLTASVSVLVLSGLFIPQARGQIVGESLKDKPGEVVYVDYMYDFVVVDFGEQDGITPGAEFDVYCGAKKIATLEAIKVREQISACNIKELSDREAQIKVGDSVTLREKLEDEILAAKQDKLKALVKEGKELYKQQQYEQARSTLQEAEQIDGDNKEVVKYLAKIDKRLQIPEATAPAEVGPRETGIYTKAGRHLVAEATVLKKSIIPISVEIKALAKIKVISVIQQVLKENGFLVNEVNDRRGIVKATRDIEIELHQFLRSEFEQFEYKTLNFYCKLSPREEGGYIFTIDPEIGYFKKDDTYAAAPVREHSAYYNEALSIALAVENRVIKVKQREDSNGAF